MDVLQPVPAPTVVEADPGGPAPLPAPTADAVSRQYHAPDTTFSSGPAPEVETESVSWKPGGTPAPAAIAQPALGQAIRATHPSRIRRAARAATTILRSGRSNYRTHLRRIAISPSREYAVSLQISGVNSVRTVSGRKRTDISRWSGRSTCPNSSSSFSRAHAGRPDCDPAHATCGWQSQRRNDKQQSGSCGARGSPEAEAAAGRAAKRVGPATVRRLAMDSPGFGTAAEGRFAALELPVLGCDPLAGPGAIAAPTAHAPPPAARAHADRSRPRAATPSNRAAALVAPVAGTPTPGSAGHAASAIAIHAAKRLSGALAARSTAPPRRPEVARDLEDTRLMLQIGVVLGLVYIAFLLLWLWATRFRPRVERSARV